MIPRKSCATYAFVITDMTASLERKISGPYPHQLCIKNPVLAPRQLIPAELRQIMQHVYYSSHENFDNGKQGKKHIKWALYRLH